MNFRKTAFLLGACLSSVTKLTVAEKSKNLRNLGKSSKKEQGKSAKSSKKDQGKSAKCSKSAKGAAACPNPSFSGEVLDATEGVKKNLFGGLQLADAVNFSNRVTSQTNLSFRTSEFLWFAWEISGDKLSDLDDRIPSGFELSMISVQEGEVPKYYIVLNLYNVFIAGFPSIRAEWSTFIRSEEGTETPYYLLLDASSSVPGIDPNQCDETRPPVELTYVVDGDNVSADLLDFADLSLVTSFTLPCQNKAKNLFDVATIFQVAAERNYWRSGVFDQGYFSSTLLDGDVLEVSTSDDDFSITDNTYWSSFYVSNVPNHVFYHVYPIDFVLNPWYNLNDIASTDSALHGCLDAFKFSSDSGFAGLAFANAIGVLGGADEALLPYTWAGANTPITYMNFEIKKSSIKKIENLLPSNLKLVKTSMREDQKATYMMTTRISEGGIGVIAEPQYYGLVVDLIVYVECESNPNEIYQMVLETKSNFDRSLANKLNAPAVSSFSYALVGNKIQTGIYDSAFSLVVDIPLSEAEHENAESTSPRQEWLVSHGRQYALNGVYDYYLCDSKLYSMTMTSIDPERLINLSVDHEWSDFVKSEPFEVLVVNQDITCIVRPWFNLYDVDIVKVWEY